MSDPGFGIGGSGIRNEKVLACGSGIYKKPASRHCVLKYYLYTEYLRRMLGILFTGRESKIRHRAYNFSLTCPVRLLVSSR
jgi:hypothetical protein